jgi:superfamily II DNA or RNA helicase
VEAVAEAEARLFPLWPEQAKALEMLKGSLRAGKRRPQLQAPTGSGKTVISAHAMTGAISKGNRAAFTVPLLSLIDQTV